MSQRVAGTSRPRPARRVAVTALALAGIAIGGCVPATATTEGHSIADLYDVFIAGGVVVAGIVWGLATWALLRYRRRNDELPSQVHGDVRIEAVWTLTPLVTVVGLFVLTLGTLDVVTASDPGAVPVQVTAFRWGWEASYPGSDRTVVGINGQPADIVLPTDQRIEVRLSSLDVDHAFFVPAFLFKKDAIPGRPTTFALTITNPGTYPGACAEYCGIGHDAMPFTIHAVSVADFQAWLAGGSLPASASPEASGPPQATGAAPEASAP